MLGIGCIILLWHSPGLHIIILLEYNRLLWFVVFCKAVRTVSVSVPFGYLCIMLSSDVSGAI